MPLIQYKELNFHAKTLRQIDQVNAILTEYEAEGFDLTVRQIYYQFVSRDLIKNTIKEYKKLANVINDARLAGLIDWSRIVDRTRYCRTLAHWDDPAGVIDSASKSFRHDLWRNQANRVEVWIEKDALVGVVERVCEANDVPFLSCRGYTSQSEMWGAAQRLMAYYNEGNGQSVHIIHLGDHDPSGIDMTRDITDRMDLFIHPEAVHIHRIALNMDQVKKYKPPPNPAKLTDSRCDGYIKKFGKKSWELDALSPKVIEAFIRKQIEDLRDEDIWERDVAQQEQERKLLNKTSDNWARVAKAVAAY